MVKFSSIALAVLLAQVVARERVPRAQLALGGLAEALLGAGMRLHLGHGQRPIEADVLG